MLQCSSQVMASFSRACRTCTSLTFFCTSPLLSSRSSCKRCFSASNNINCLDTLETAEREERERRGGEIICKINSQYDSNRENDAGHSLKGTMPNVSSFLLAFVFKISSAIVTTDGLPLYLPLQEVISFLHIGRYFCGGVWYFADQEICFAGAECTMQWWEERRQQVGGSFKRGSAKSCWHFGALRIEILVSHLFGWFCQQKQTKYLEQMSNNNIIMLKTKTNVLNWTPPISSCFSVNIQKITFRVD